MRAGRPLAVSRHFGRSASSTYLSLFLIPPSPAPILPWLPSSSLTCPQHVLAYYVCGKTYPVQTVARSTSSSPPLQLTQVKNVDLRVIMHAGDAIPKSGVSPRRSRNERKMMIGRALLLAWNLNKREEEEENE